MSHKVCTVVAINAICFAAQANASKPRFSEIAKDPASGLTSYRRAPSAQNVSWDFFEQNGLLLEQFPATPVKAHGAPGVALLDYDNDGDLDIYVTNGPGADNSLFASDFAETGKLTFVDVAADAGVAATSQDGTGVCFGDIDNDGDLDLYALGRIGPNRLFENEGDGTFSDISLPSGTEAGSYNHTSCSMGDVNGDGLLDIVVSNTFDWSTSLAVFVVPFDVNHPNQLFINQGGNVFLDTSESSGLRNLLFNDSSFDGSSTISWAIAMVDYDQDGDTDIVEADGNGAIPFAKYGGVDRGLIHLMNNDGTGHFTDLSPYAATNVPGQWMGLSFGDLDHDGELDMFATSFGDWAVSNLTFVPYTLGDSTSRWFFGQPDGSFVDPGVGAIVADGFGWGTSMLDYDNDGHTDIIYVGGFDLPSYTDLSNPGTVLANDGTGYFTYDANAFGTELADRVSQGMAVGDLNQDGATDMVSASSFNVPAALPAVPYTVSYGSPFDPPVASYLPQFAQVSPDFTYEFNGVEVDPGSLSVLINRRSRSNGHVAVRTIGSVGIVQGARVNRSGIGAIVTVTPKRGLPSMRPVVGGSSYQSTDALEGVFGLGQADSAIVDVFWQGGTRNRLYDVKDGETVSFPELPCSIDAKDFKKYKKCVDTSLEHLRHAGILSRREQKRFYASALRAFADRP